MTRYGSFYSEGKDSLHLESEPFESHIHERLTCIRGEDKMSIPIKIGQPKLREYEAELGKVAKALIEEEGMVASWNSSTKEFLNIINNEKSWLNSLIQRGYPPHLEFRSLDYGVTIIPDLENETISLSVIKYENRKTIDSYTISNTKGIESEVILQTYETAKEQL